MKKLSSIFLTILLTFASFANQKKLSLAADVARFRGDSSQVYLELYYSFDVSSLQYEKKDSEYYSEAIITISIQRSGNDSLITRQAFRLPFSVNDTTLLQTSRNYNDVVGFLLFPDVYRIQCSVQDRYDSSHQEKLSFPISIKSIEKNSATLSDIELATSIVPMEKTPDNRFYKNTFEVKPNTTRLYGEHQPVLFYYLETYNLLTISSPQYYTQATITNALGKEMNSVKKTKNTMHESNVEVGVMKVHELKTGAYTFTFSLLDSTKSIASTSKKFFIYNSSLQPDTLINTGENSILASEYATMTEEDLDKEFEQCRYIALKNEIDSYAQLSNVEAKRKALFNFWSARDDDKTTSVNEAKREYFEKVRHTNERYNTGYKQGWKSDRGRVYIMYGQPDEVERHASEVNMKPYEVWYYHSLQGGVQFIFGDRTGFSDYILLHSTLRGEIHDESWQRYLQVQ